MTGKSGRGGIRGRHHHEAFGPPIGSFEFTGENAKATDHRRPGDSTLTLAARSFLMRVGKGHR